MMLRGGLGDSHAWFGCCLGLARGWFWDGWEWVMCGDSLGMLWDSFGEAWGMLWGCFGHVLGRFRG
jgi:hypothetical protein